MYSFNFNGFTIENGDDYVIENLDGLQRIPVRSAAENRLGSNGGVIYARNLGMRRIVAAVEISADSLAEYVELRDNLAQNLSITSGDQLTISLSEPNTGQLIRERLIYAKVVALPDLQEQSGDYATALCMVDFQAENPLFFDTAVTGAIINLQQVQGFDIPFDIPFDLNATGNNTVNLSNEGNAATNLKVTFTGGGGITNPRITNKTTGESVRITRSLSSSDTVVVERDQQGITAVLNGTQNVFSDLEGDLPSVVAGSNTIEFTAQGFDATATATVEFRSAYLSF